MTKEAAEELEEMGEDTSDMIMSQSKMRDLIMNATKVASNDYKGFDIQDELGRYKSTYEIMLGLSQIWDEIQQADFKTGDNRQNLLLESIAGKNRASIAASILQNPNVLQSVYEDSSTKAANSAMKENQKYLDSISGHLARLTNAWQEMWASAANREVINGVIDLATAILKLVDDVGLLGTAFAVLYGGAIVKGLTSANSWLVKFVGSLDRLRESSTSVGELLSNIFGGNKTDTDNGNGFFKGLAQINKNREQTSTPTPETPTPEIPESVDNSAVTEQLAAEKIAQDALNQSKAEGTAIQAEYNNTKQQEADSSAENIIEETTEKQAEELAQNKKKLEVKPFLDGEKEKQEAIRESAFEQAEADAQSVAGSAEVAGADEVEASAELGAAAAHDVSKESSNADAIATNRAADASMKDAAASEMEEAAKKAGESAGAGAGASGLVAGLTSPVTWLVLLPAIISAISFGLGALKKYQEGLVDGAHEATNVWNENKASLDDYAQQYQDLHAQLENASLSEEEQIGIKKQIFDLQKKITDQYGHQADGVNLVNGQLDEQLKKLQQIKRQEASDNLQHHGAEYTNAKEQLTEVQRSYTLDTKGIQISDDLYKTLFSGLEGTWTRFYNAASAENPFDSAGVQFSGTALEAEKAMEEMFDRLTKIKDKMGEKWSGSLYETIMNSLVDATAENDNTLTKFKDDYIAWQEQSIWSNKGTYGDLQLTAGEILVQLEEAVNNYNAALLSGDTSQIEKAKESYDELIQAQNDFLQGSNVEYSDVFTDITDKLNQAQIDVYNIKQKMQTEKGKSIIESTFGEIKENKKDAKEINDELIETAQHMVDMQRQANEWGVIDNLNPITGTAPKKTKYGNIDLNNRQVLNWNKDTISQFKDAWDSYGKWGKMPEIGDISTVLGGSGEFQGVEIAFSPILQGEDGKPVLLSHDSLTTYLDAVVHSATNEKTGKVNLDEIIKIDGDPKRGGKKLIAAVGAAGDESVKKLAKSMHFMGKDGALASGMRDLAHMAREANIPITEVMHSLQQSGNTSGLENMLNNTVVSAADVQDALMGADDAVSQMLADLAGDFGITMETPEDQIQAFINQLAEMGYVAAESTQSSQSSLDHFFADTSARIETLTSLTSVIQKGQSQTGLTFTKTLDENKNEVASEVKSIVDAYKTLDGFDLGSLFEETGTGIKLNYDAYRALAQEEEAEIKRQYKLERAALEAQLATAPSDQQDSIKQQIIELDMLSSAYDGVTSALSKYLNQQNAADYGDTYSMLQGTTLNRGDELLNKGLIGTEEFRSIAQLFSFESLATKDAAGVAEAYEQGTAMVRKYFTENAVDGVFQFATDIEQLPEQFGNIAKDAEGAFTFDITDQQLSNLAEHFKVSTDVIEAFFDQIRATGGEVHIWRDGGYEDFDNLNKNIDESKEKLQELKETTNDPNLIPDDAFNWDASSLDTVDKIRQKIEDMKNIQAKIGDPDTEAWKQAQQIIDDLEKKLQGYEEAERNARNTSPITVESYQEANEIIKQVNDGLLEMQKLEDQEIKVSVDGKDGTTPSETLQNLSVQISQLPDEIQEYVMIEAGLEWHEGMTPEEIQQQLQGKFETTRIPVEADTTEAENQINNLGNETGQATGEISYTAKVDTTEAETALTTMRQSAEQPIEVPVTVVAQNSEEEIIPQDETAGTSISYMVNVDTSEAESSLETMRESGEQPIEVPVTVVAQNTVQDAINQANGNQPAVVNQETNTTETVNHVENYQANTSGLEEAKNKLQELMSFKGQEVNLRASISDAPIVDKLKKKIEDLVAKAKSKINITVNGNAAPFNKVHSDTISKLNEITKKDTTAKIKGDNSNLKDKVSEAKSKLSSIDDKKVHITASATGFSEITSWKTGTYDKLKDKTIKIKTEYSSSGSKPSPFNGSAHNQGTIMSNGHAYAGGTLSGNWGLPKAEKGALINELGSEIIVTPDGHWQILNSGDPTFTNLPKGAIIFNHKQTESLLKKGYVNGSHGKIVGGAFASGTVDDEDLEGEAFITGTTGWNGALSGAAFNKYTWKPPKKTTTKTTKTTTKKKKSSSNDSGGNHSGGNHSSSNSSAKDFLQTLDAIEIQLQRVDAELQRLDTNANKTFESFSVRASSFAKEITTITKEIKKLDKSISSKGYKGDENNPASYYKKAYAAAKAAGYKSDEEGANKKKNNMVDQELPKEWINRIKNGVEKGALLTLNDVKDEGLWRKIQAYQTWYEKGIKLEQKRREYLNKINQLTIANLQLLQKQYESAINLLNEQMNTNQQKIEYQSSRKYNNTIKYLNDSIDFDTTKKNKLTKEKTALQHALNVAVKKGYIKENSEEWYTWTTNIEKISGQIMATQNDIVAKTNQKLEYIQESWQLVLDNLDKTAENYNISIERQNSKQKIGQRFDKKSKYADQYKASTPNQDEVAKYYDKLVKNEESRKTTLEKERNRLQAQLDSAVKNERFQKDSQEYKKWVNEIKDLNNQILETENNMVENVVSKLEYIEDKWDTLVDHFSTISDRYKEFADLQSAQGYVVSKKYYQGQQNKAKQQIEAMTKEAADLQERLNEAVNSGYITKYSAEWYEWATKIEDIRNNIVGLQKDIVDLANDIRQLDWDRFDTAQDRIKTVTEEMEFLNDLIREDDLFDDKGVPTEKAQASAGLIAQQYDLLTKQAERYKTKVQQINEQLVHDRYNQTLIKQRDEWLEAQQDAIKAAEQQKQAMVDLAEKGIKKQIEAMNELISKYEEALDKQRAQEQYAKGIADRQKAINNLEKQLRSMGGDDSEEGRVRRQQLRDQLKQAQQDLKDTQEDKRVSDIKEALKEMQDKYEETLNDRLKNIDALFGEAINRINQNGTSIVSAIEAVGKSVNYTFSAELAKTYEGAKNTNKDDSHALVTNTKSNGTIKNNDATTLNTIEKINDYLNKATAYSDKIATDKIASISTSTTTKKKTTTTKKGTTTKKKTTVTTKKTTTKKSTTTKKTTVTTKKTTTTTKKGTKTTTKKTTTANLSATKLVYKSTTTTTKKPTGITLVNKPNTKIGSTASLKDTAVGDATRASKTLATATTKKKTSSITLVNKPNTKNNSTTASKDSTSKSVTKASKTSAIATTTKLKHGTYTENGKKVFYYNGKKQTGLFYGNDGKKRLVDSSTGTLVKGWRTIGNKSTYYFDKNGRAVTGLQTINGAQYYFNEIAILKKGTFTVGNTTYTTDNNGKILSKKSATAGHLAKGTPKVKRSGIYEVDEHGGEVFINQNGKIYTRLDKGSTVLPHDAAVNLLKGMTDPLGFIAGHMDLHPNKNITTTNNTAGDTTNYITFNIPNVSNYSEFMREAQRDPNFTKYIQEISLGKLNGNNSLKGNSIRFR